MRYVSVHWWTVNPYTYQCYRLAISTTYCIFVLAMFYFSMHDIFAVEIGPMYLSTPYFGLIWFLPIIERTDAC